MRALLFFILFIPNISLAKKVNIKDLNYTASCTSTASIYTTRIDENGEKKIEIERKEKELEIIGSKSDGQYSNSISFTHDIGEGYDLTLEFTNLQDIKELNKEQRKKIKKQGSERLHPFYISYRYDNAESLDVPEDGVSEFPVVLGRSPASLGGIGTHLNNKFYLNENSYAYFQIYCKNVKEEISDELSLQDEILEEE